MYIKHSREQTALVLQVTKWELTTNEGSPGVCDGRPVEDKFLQVLERCQRGHAHVCHLRVTQDQPLQAADTSTLAVVTHSKTPNNETSPSYAGQ